MPLDKQFKEFVKQFQKDVNEFQKTIQKEGDVLVKKFKKVANKDSLLARGKEIEQLVESKLQKFEPALGQFLTKVTKQAERAGLDISELEKTVMNNFQKARSRLRDAAKKMNVDKPGRKTTAKKAAKKTGKAKPAAQGNKPATKKKTTAARGTTSKKSKT